MNIYRTIIIDDETIARQRLIRMLDEFHGSFDVVAEAKNGFEGAEKINTLKPDLIFLDIQMPVQTGFEMLENLTYIPYVVFCTAYEEFALKAFNTMALDYLVKPLEKERLQLTLDKLNRNSEVDSQLQVQALLKLVKQQTIEKKIQSIPHKIGDRILLIKTDRICYLLANDKYVDFYTKDGEKYLTELSVKKLMTCLPNNFKQVKRGVIVNINFIVEYRKYFRGKYILILDDVNKTKVETGRSFNNDLKNIIAIE